MSNCTKTKYHKLLQFIIPKLHENAYASPQLSFCTCKHSLIIASLAINLMSLALPVMTLQIYDRILVYKNAYTLDILATGVIIVTALDAVIRLMRIYLINWSGTTHEYTVYCNSMRHLFSLEQNLVEKEGNAATHLQRMAYINKLRDFFSGQVLTVLIDIPFIIIFLMIIFYLTGILVLIPLIVLLMFGIVSRSLSNSLKNMIQHRETSYTNRLDFIIESLKGIHTIKAMALEKIFQRKYEKFQLATSKANYNLYTATLDILNYSNIFTEIMVVGIVAFGAPMAMQGEFTLGTLIACVLLSARIMQPLQKAVNLLGKYQSLNLYLDNINKTFELPSIEKIDPKLLPNNEGTLELSNVSFYYDENYKILNNINLKLKRGDSISISGDHNIGKSTFLKLIVGAYKPKTGKILINGLEASKYPASHIGKYIAFLPMTGVIFRGTIWENLSAFGTYSDEAVKEIATLTGLYDEVKKLPEGYNTYLEGSNSDPITPGLKQRIAITRALVPKPRIILFDDADRSLDKDGYNKVYTLLARLRDKATMILITDDLNLQQLTKKQFKVIDSSLVDKTKDSDYDLHGSLYYKELPI